MDSTYIDWKATEKTYKAEAEKAKNTATFWRKADGKLASKFDNLSKANQDIAEYIKERRDGQ